MTHEVRWRFASASVVGTSHERSGAPCQDNHACRVLPDQNKVPILVVVVSDGAGSADKSEIGSALACCSIIEQAQGFFEAGRTVRNFTKEDADKWVRVVRGRIGKQAEDDNGMMRDYACTLLVAIVSEDASAFFQLGDGAIVVSAANNDWCCVFWPQRGEYANTTYFVTEAGALDHLEFSSHRQSIQDLAVFTDGIEALVLDYANKSAYAPFFERMIVPVRASTACEQDPQLSQALNTYLASPLITARTDDDKTLVLATRRTVPTVPAVPEEVTHQNASHDVRID